MRQQEMFERGDGHRSRRLAIAVLCAVSALALAMATTAQASVIKIGSVLPPEWESKKFDRVETVFNTALPEPGATLASPVNGAVIRWSVQGAVGGPFYLRVLHPDGKGAYEAAGKSAAAVPVSTGLLTFETNLKIQAGDLIGVDPTSESDEIGVKTESGASYASIFPTPFEGTIAPPSKTFSGAEIELSAEVQPAPEVSAVTPASGPVTGGTLVTITGKNLTGASAVRFGTAPATSFTVDSDTEITATAPSNLRPGKVDVSVATFAGENPNTRFDDYVYRACVVPAIKGKTLKRTKTLLRRQGCKLGHVKKADAPKPSKVGKVLKQAPKPGKVLAPGSRVRITLGE
ncbi:MAG TPA: IPT/TIG domain-containing protein [Solirubrobacterales bacterium]|nr:IPT/TIG domain-containing protein [Solirubrobacterales bacterium]